MKLWLTFFVVIISHHKTSSQENTNLRQFIHGNVKFSTEIYKSLLKTEPGDFVFSPFSSQVILALLQAGAKGTTREEIITATHLAPEGLKNLVPSLEHLTDGTNFTTANRMYVSKDINILKEYEKLGKESFDADVEKIDFINGLYAAQKINHWVEQKTNNRIKNIIKPENLDETTRLVLVNTLYFKGRWANPFDPLSSTKEKFYRRSGDAIDVDMMFVEDDFHYTPNPKLKAQIVELPYGSGDVTMTIVLPNDKSGLEALEREALEEALYEPKSKTLQRLYLKLPKFTTEAEFDLKPALKEWGVKRIFDPSQADLSYISPDKGLFVDQIKQKTFIKVDESGTEAAAASYGKVALLSAFITESPPIPFVADHPFIYFIKYNGTILFVGRVTM